jgi:hypothetical protein
MRLAIHRWPNVAFTNTETTAFRLHVSFRQANICTIVELMRTFTRGNIAR